MGRASLHWPYLAITLMLKKSINHSFSQKWLGKGQRKFILAKAQRTQRIPRNYRLSKTISAFRRISVGISAILRRHFGDIPSAFRRYSVGISAIFRWLINDKQNHNITATPKGVAIQITPITLRGEEVRYAHLSPSLWYRNPQGGSNDTIIKQHYEPNQEG